MGQGLTTINNGKQASVTHLGLRNHLQYQQDIYVMLIIEQACGFVLQNWIKYEPNDQHNC
jgi:hypothetical protein